MDYTKTTAYTRYSLNIEAARKDLKHHGVDLELATKISSAISDVISEYGDSPEVALACVVTGYNAKCMADQDSGFIYSEEALSNPEIHKLGAAFNVVNALIKRHEDDLYEVISSWRVD